MKNKKEQSLLKKLFNKLASPFRRPMSWISKSFDKQPLIAFTLVTVFLMFGIFLMEQGAQWFKASVFDVPTFEGTASPVQKVPDWTQNGGDNSRKYSEYSASELIDFPEYNLSVLQSNAEDKDTINAKITYSVVYLGNYQLDHTEDVGSHLAVDIKIPVGTPIFSVANGTVEKAVDQNTGFGKHICIKHNAPDLDGEEGYLYSCYAHLSKLLVSEGDQVSAGDQIAESGDTGTSTTPHLHFQVDKDSAPYHPWWPFTSSEASEAGLSFFGAINAGLGKAEAKNNTVNPIKWVQEYKTYTASSDQAHSVADENPAEEAQVLSDFGIAISQDDKSVEIKIVAQDEKGKTIKDFDGSSVQLLATDKSLDIPDFSFENGVATIELEITESTTFIARQGAVLTSADVKVAEVAVDKEAIFSISGDDFVKVDKSLSLSISLEGNLSEEIDIEIDGEGKVSPKSLDESDFSKGKAKISFSSDTEGETKITIGNASYKINVVSDILPVSEFEIETPNSFILGKKTEITIYGIDEDGNKTPKSFNGTISLSLESGEGEFEENTLFSDDFRNGSATFNFTAKGNERIKIKAKSGVLIGISNRARVEEGEIFSDLDKGDEHYTAISSLAKDDIISGFSDGTFKSNNSINRVETIKMLLLALQVPVISGELAFADTDSEAWFADYLYTGVSEEIVVGYDDGTFRPANAINRAEFFKILLNSAEVNLDQVKRAPFSDVEEDDWFASYAKYARDNDLLDFDDGKFYPSQEINRGEVAEALYRLKY